MRLEAPAGPGPKGWRRAALELRKSRCATVRVSLCGTGGRASTGMLTGALRRSARDVVDGVKRPEPNENMVRSRGGSEPRLERSKGGLGKGSSHSRNPIIDLSVLLELAGNLGKVSSYHVNAEKTETIDLEFDEGAPAGKAGDEIFRYSDYTGY
ncbi:hypothetical protein NDU88_003083 [Pleurodeles waltl]|uniref:Uncharacterized protein n=1 Tax=Pleurodeles waltl TaxID=8319 RepID=A0AAV7KXG8_PLEWA|nr:hypothetical protein NDU88_003083 [Pleurodeles waltl]